MKIFQGSTPITVLATWMANMECGETRFVDEGGAHHPAPDPYPVVTVPPLTEGAPPRVLCVKPAVATLYYTAGPGFSLQEFVGELCRALARLGEAHITQEPRAVDMTPSGVIRRIETANSGIAVHGPIRTFQVAEKLSQVGSRGKRVRALVLIEGAGSKFEPPIKSTSALFTWFLAPLGCAIDRKPDFQRLESLLAAAAALVYDGADVVAAEGGEPEVIQAKHLRRRPTTKQATAAIKAIRAAEEYAIPYMEQGVLNFLSARHPQLTPDPPQTDGELAWNELKTAGAASCQGAGRLPPPRETCKCQQTEQTKCAHCETPLWGRVYVVRGASLLVPPQALEGAEAWASSFTPGAGKRCILPETLLMEKRSSDDAAVDPAGGYDVVFCADCAGTACEQFRGRHIDAKMYGSIHPESNRENAWAVCDLWDALRPAQGTPARLTPGGTIVLDGSLVLEAAWTAHAHFADPEASQLVAQEVGHFLLKDSLDA